MIISFYSYKGGAGRTQLCVNVAEYLCYKLNRKVLLWDWDLEAPGIHVFFGMETKTFDHPGTIELLNHYVRLMRMKEQVYPDDLRDTLDFLEPIPLVPPTQEGGSISLLSGGNYSKNYEYKISSFDWPAFTDDLDGKSFLYDHLRHRIKQLGFDYVLIDSRTGVSDYAGLCNILLPDLNVLVVTPHEQSFEGNLKIAHFIKDSEFVKQKHRKPYILPIFSRLELTGTEHAQELLKKFKKRFGSYYQSIFEAVGGSLARYQQDENLYINQTLLAHEPTLTNQENLLFSKYKDYIGMPYRQNLIHIADILEAIVFKHNFRYKIEEKGIRFNGSPIYPFQKLKSCILWMEFQQPYSDPQYLVRFELKLRSGETLKLLQTPFAFTYREPKANQQDVLFETCFIKDIAQVCQDFIGLLRDGKIESLRWVVSAPESLQNAPFEALLNHFEPNYEQKSLQMSLVRTRKTRFQDFNPVPPSQKARPLSVLYAAALPNRLEPSRLQMVSNLCHPLKNETDLAVESLFPVSFLEIQEALRSRQPEILHLCVYVEQDTDKQINLFLEDEMGNLAVLRVEQFGSMLQNAHSLRVLVLNVVSRQDLSTKVAYQLAHFSTPCIVQVREAWTALAQFEFYKALQNGKSPAQALTQVRMTTELGDNAILLYQNQVVKGLLNTQIASKPKNTYYALKPSMEPRTPRIGRGFVGRKRHLIAMQQAFRRHQPICLYGLGGLGKTTLAEAFAYHYAAQHGAEIIIFKDDNQINELYIIEKLIYVFEKRFQQQAVGLKQLLKNKNSTALDLLKTLIAHFPSDGRLILLFDNCESLQKGAKYEIAPASLGVFFKYMCANAPQGCHIIFTTRYRIAELEPRTLQLSLDHLSFEEQNQFLDDSPVLRNILETDRKQLYDRFEGHPRSYVHLESLMTRDHTFHWDSVAKETKETVLNNILLEKIYNRLSTSEQLFFEQMAACVTRTHYKTLAYLTQLPIELLEKQLNVLANWSLCLLDVENQTFTAHPLIREWAYQSIPLDRLMEYRFRLGHYLSNEITDITHSNLESALLAKKYFELAGEIGFMDFAETALSLQNYFQKIGDYERAIVLNNTVLGLPVNRLLHSDARNNLGMIAYHQSDIDTAQNFFEQSLAIRQLENNEIRIAESYHNIATLYHKLKKYEDAKVYFQKSLTIKRALIEQGSTEHVTLHITLNNLSQISDELGVRDEALDYLNESLRIAQQAGDKQGEWTASINMANIYLKMGDATTALQYYLKAEALQDQEAQPNEQIALLLKIGQLYAALPDYPKALQRVLQAFTLAKQYDLDNEKVKFRLGEIIYHAGRQTVATWLKSYKK